MRNQVIYPGTFDPITNGHLDIIERASNLFEQIVVAISASFKKEPLFSLAERAALATKILAPMPRVVVCTYSGLLVDLARQQNIMAILRGLRAVSDFEYEFQLAGMNRCLEPRLETIFLATSEKYANLSASMVREIVALGGDVSKFVPKAVLAALKEKLR